MVLQRHGHELVVDLAFDGAIERRQEILAVVERVEAEDVGTEQVQQQLALPRADAKGLGVWPRDVPEQRDGRARHAFPDQLREQREVEVLDEHDRVGRRRFRGYDIGELGD